MTKIFSGMRPSGKLHLGNYLGAIKNWIELQDAPNTEQCIFAAVDLHGITTPYEPKELAGQIHDVLLDYLAAGVNPEKSLLVRQSHISEHAELMWLLSTITPVGWLERLPNWREKVEQVAAMRRAGSPRDSSRPAGPIRKRAGLTVRSGLPPAIWELLIPTFGVGAGIRTSTMWEALRTLARRICFRFHRIPEYSRISGRARPPRT